MHGIRIGTVYLRKLRVKNYTGHRHPFTLAKNHEFIVKRRHGIYLEQYTYYESWYNFMGMRSRT